ncbi:MAG TPA: alpha/beta fold hydrolase, partial [Halothiobacillaceae bacterium]|nr:alpha/beta fold hydrolase [Halothiobacillaceae bacterium]
VVLMVHGTLAHGQMEIMESMQSLLAEAGYNALAVNLSLGLDGREGMYDCDVTHRHKHEEAVDEIAAWVEWLKGEGAKRLAVLGHSRGGNQVARYLADQPDPMVEKAVLLAPQTWSPGYYAKDYKSNYDTELGPLLEKAEALLDAGRGDEIMEMDFIYCPDTRVAAESVVSYYREDPMMDTPTVLGETSVPTLVVVAGADTTVTDLEARMADRVEDDHIEMTVVSGADHMFRDLFLYDAADAATAFIGWN